MFAFSAPPILWLIYYFINIKIFTLGTLIMSQKIQQNLPEKIFIRHFYFREM